MSCIYKCISYPYHIHETFTISRWWIVFFSPSCSSSKAAQVLKAQLDLAKEFQRHNEFLLGRFLFFLAQCVEVLCFFGGQNAFLENVLFFGKSGDIFLGASFLNGKGTWKTCFFKIWIFEQLKKKQFLGWFVSCRCFIILGKFCAPSKLKTSRFKSYSTQNLCKTLGGVGLAGPCFLVITLKRMARWPVQGDVEWCCLFLSDSWDKNQNHLTTARFFEGISSIYDWKAKNEMASWNMF